MQDVIEEIGGETAGHTDVDPAELEGEIRDMVSGYVGADVDVSMPLAAQGLDSLAAMELRQKLQVRCFFPLGRFVWPIAYCSPPSNHYFPQLPSLRKEDPWNQWKC